MNSCRQGFPAASPAYSNGPFAPPDPTTTNGPGTLLVGRPDASPLIYSLVAADQMEPLGDEGCLIQTVSLDEHPALLVTARAFQLNL